MWKRVSTTGCKTMRSVQRFNLSRPMTRMQNFQSRPMLNCKVIKSENDPITKVEVLNTKVPNVEVLDKDLPKKLEPEATDKLLNPELTRVLISWGVLGAVLHDPIFILPIVGHCVGHVHSQSAFVGGWIGIGAAIPFFMYRIDSEIFSPISSLIF